MNKTCLVFLVSLMIQPVFPDVIRTDDKLGFQINVPTGWEATLRESICVSIESKDKNARVLVCSLEKKGSASEYIGEYLRKRGLNTAGIKPVSNQLIAKAKAIAGYDVGFEDEGKSIYMITFETSNRLFAITGQVLPEKNAAQNLHETVIKIIDTFSVRSAPVFSDSLKEIFQRKWRGVSQQDAGNLTRDGKVHIEQRYKFIINADDTITGTFTAIFTLDNVSYTREGTIKGRFYPAEQQVFISDDVQRRGDKLPYGLYWCSSRGYLKLYNLAGKPGHYTLKGTMKGYTAGCESTSEAQLSDVQ